MAPKWVATALVLASSVAAVGLAGPASATDQITQNGIGTYKFRVTHGSATWIATTCADDANQCIHVTELRGKRKIPRWSANAYWSVGSWIMFVDESNVLKCKDGTTHDLRVNYSWDAATNEGWRSYFDPGICNGKARTRATPFKLIKTGPPPPATTDN